MSEIRGWALAGVMALVAMWCGCSRSDGPSGPGDTTAPAQTTTLSGGSPTTGSVTLTWTAPGDDGTSGRATSYDIRYSLLALNEVTWDSAQQVASPPAPRTPGSVETVVVTGLNPATTYHFRLKTGDEVPNFSLLSNVVTAATASTDTLAPAVVGDLAITSTGSNSVQLSWTAPGDDGNIGTAAQYDIRYSTATITLGNFASATQATGEPAPEVAGTPQTVTLTGLDPLTNYFFALKTADEVPNTSGLSNLAQGVTTPPDTIPPAAVTLSVGTVTSDSIQVTWTAPGDDSITGTAGAYDLRFSTNPIDEGNWAAATPVNPQPTVHAPGDGESYFVRGLTPTTTYYFALKTGDDAGNLSAISNSPFGTTLEGWSALGPGMSNNVYCLAISQGAGASIFAGGVFSASSGQPGNRIARWDGTQWRTVGSGVLGTVQCLGFFNDDVIAGGFFNTAGGIPANNIASWDRSASTWSALGSGVTGGTVSAVTVFNSDLIAGGSFNHAGGSAANAIARWTGSTWSPLGPGLDGSVSALEIYTSDLIVGGFFSLAGTDTVNNIARWDGATWTPLGSGMDGRVACLLVYNGDLIAGGSFTTAGGVPAENIAMWNGTAWGPLGAGVAGPPGSGVNSLTIYNGDLIVGGSFTSAGGATANHIARWNGGSWRSMGAGMTGPGDAVAALAVYNFDLIAGGQFGYAGATQVNNIARWHE